MTIDILSFAVALLAYLIGCFPSSWLVVRLVAGKDVRHEGTGNMGAMNSYDVTGKKWIGIVVTILDALKGYLAVQLALWMGANFFGVTMAAVFSVLGHCFNVFFRFHGGRGLATATGIALAINPLPLVLWNLMYLTGYFVIRRDVHVGSVSGTLGLMALLYTTPSSLISMFMLVMVYDISQFKLMVFMLCIVIFLKHIEPMRQLFRHLQEEDTKSAADNDVQ